MIKRSYFIKGSDNTSVDEGRDLVDAEEAINTMVPSNVCI